MQPTKTMFGTGTRVIECAEIVAYNDRVMSDGAFSELKDKLHIAARGAAVETLALYTIIKPGTLHYRAGAISVHSDTDPQGAEVFSLVESASNTTLLYFTPVND